MNITIICVGKAKESYLKEGIDEYLKRLSKYCNVKIVEVEDEKAPEGMSQLQEEIVRDKEADRIKKVIKPGSFVIALDIMGKTMSSEEFSGVVSRLGVSGTSDITFIIGGSIGLSYDILDKAGLRLSFSRMTFPHQLMRLILVEQIYRGFRIMRGEPYHKGSYSTKEGRNEVSFKISKK